MVIIDVVTIRTLFYSWTLRKEAVKDQHHRIVWVLDLESGAWSLFLVFFARHALRIVIQELDFFVGDLKTKEGEGVWASGQNLTSLHALSSAESLIASSPVLGRVNRIWLRNSYLLFLAKQIFYAAGYPGDKTILKVLVVDCLKQQERWAKCFLVLANSSELPKGILRSVSPNIVVKIYKKQQIHWIQYKALFLWHVTALISSLIVANFRWVLVWRKAPRSKQRRLLLPQEEELLASDAHRGQPHWLNLEENEWKYHTLILGNKAYPNDNDVLANLRKYQFEVDGPVTKGWLPPSHVVSKKLWRTIFCLATTFVRTKLSHVFILLRH